MKKSLTAVSLLLLIACTSQPKEEAKGGSTERTAQAEPEGTCEEPQVAKKSAAAAPRVSLEELEGTWSRDDGVQYLLVARNAQLQGYRLDDDAPFGCRLELGLSDGEVVGVATFTRREDEAAPVMARWELRVAAKDRLMGRVEGIDLDVESGDAEVARTWEMHDLRRVGPLAGEEAETARKAVAAHLAIDRAIQSNDKDQQVALFASEEVNTMLGVDAFVSRRLTALAMRLVPPESLATAEEPGEGTVEASSPRDEEPAGDEPVASEEQPAAEDAPEDFSGQPDMKGFLAKFEGTNKGVTEALDTYGTKKLERNNMDWFDLREPEIVKEEKTADGAKYTIDCKAGMTIRTYTLVWKGGKVIEVIEVGMR